MDRPRVIIHNLISLYERLDGFPADAGLCYEMASRLPHQAVLTGSGTMLNRLCPAASGTQTHSCAVRLALEC